MSDRARSLRQVLAAGSARARVTCGLGVEEAAERLRSCGLTSWQAGTVSQVEAGVRPLAVEELLLLCVAYGVTPAELAGPADGGPVELTPGATLAAAAVRALLADDGAALRAVDVPVRRSATAGDPVPSTAMVTAAQRFGVQGPAAVSRALAGIGDAERNAARRLGVPPERLVLAAVGRWGRPLTLERDARIEQRRATTSPDRHIMLRGLVTRELLAELEDELFPAR